MNVDVESYVSCRVTVTLSLVALLANVADTIGYLTSNAGQAVLEPITCYGRMGLVAEVTSISSTDGMGLHDAVVINVLPGVQGSGGDTAIVGIPTERKHVASGDGDEADC